MDDCGQTALGMMAGQTYKLIKMWDKLIYLSADSASVNSREDSGLIVQFQEEHKKVVCVVLYLLVRVSNGGCSASFY